MDGRPQRRLQPELLHGCMGQAAEVEPGNGAQGVQVNQDFELVRRVDVPISFVSF